MIEGRPTPGPQTKRGGLSDWLLQARHPMQDGVVQEEPELTDLEIMITTAWREAFDLGFDSGLAHRYSPESDWGKLREMAWRNHRQVLADKVGLFSA